MTSKISLLLGAAMIAHTAPLSAQTREEATAPDHADKRNGEQDRSAQRSSDEILVTGRYTVPERIDTATGLGLTVRETPQSVSVITEQRIIDQNLDSVADVIRNAVGVSMNEIDDVRNTFSSRGFDIQNYQVDGVPLSWTLAGGAGETIADVSIYQRIEIVRGATGLLTGAGDPSASVNLVRKHADSVGWQGYANASVGSWDNWQLTADVGGALTANGDVRARAVARYGEGDSYIDLYHNKKLVLYGVVDADITPDTLLRVGASHQTGKPTAPAWGALPSFYSDGSFAVWPRSKTASADWAFWDTTNENIFATVQHSFGNGWNLTFDYNWLRNAQTSEILYLSGLVDPDTGRIQSTYPYSDDGESIQNSFDLKLNGTVGLFGRQHEFVLGALHSVMNRENTTYAALSLPDPGDYIHWDGSEYPYPGFSDEGSLEVDERTEQTGYYGAFRLNVSDRLKVIGGGRLSSWELSGFNFGDPREYGDDGVFIPYAGVLYDLTAHHRLYASYTEIFEPQNARDRNGDYLAPIRGKAYEIGLKSAFFNDALQTSVALFRIEQDNLAQPDIGHFIPGVNPPAQASYAAEGATSQGFEVEVTGRPAPDWNINAGISHFEIDDADDAPVNTDYPRTLFKLFTTYRLPASLHRLVLGGGVTYRSKAYSEGSNPTTGTPFRFQQDGYALVNLMARYDLTPAIQLQANVQNLFDVTYYSQIGFYSQYRYGAPRNFTISAAYRF
ncbi:TonB-dependent siderophore receptor [Stakelama saccharophila]|uniref:TonB-dependent siderophore receptor n=1 Tax=Stakelama saccharophila TaxID=3075605 RepID=A0ABZ0B599_9SPHN|nr:TonB-dependent siderophore receptor [Stakelama sp. W311]WNO52566.1 TonB-dependent siderophore receptor [Stakelama sp. W311]